MRNAGLEEAQAGIKIARRNINNLRYADGTKLMAESEEELKSFLGKVKEKTEKADLKLNIQKNEDHGIWFNHFMTHRWGNKGNSDRLYFLGLQNHYRWRLQPWGYLKVHGEVHPMEKLYVFSFLLIFLTLSNIGKTAMGQTVPHVPKCQKRVKK